MDVPVLQAFTREFVKTAFYGSSAAPRPGMAGSWTHTIPKPFTTGQKLKNLLYTGWHGHAPGSIHGAAAGSGWTWGKKGLGKVMPGGKTLTLLGTGMMLRGALHKGTDEKGRSRAERVAGVTGQTLGGLAASGAAMGLAKRSPYLGAALGMVGGVGGSILGEKILTAPFKAGRKVMSHIRGPRPVSVAPEGQANLP